MKRHSMDEDYIVQIKARGREYKVNNDSFVGLDDLGKVYLLDNKDDRTKPGEVGVRLSKEKFNKWLKDGSLIDLGKSVEYTDYKKDRTFKLKAYRFNVMKMLGSKVR